MSGKHLSTAKPLSPEQRERKRAYDRARAHWIKGGPCGHCASSGCEGFRGDLTDTYDRADCRACGGKGYIR